MHHKTIQCLQAKKLFSNVKKISCKEVFQLFEYIYKKFSKNLVKFSENKISPDLTAITYLSTKFLFLTLNMIS